MTLQGYYDQGDGTTGHEAYHHADMSNVVMEKKEEDLLELIGNEYEIWLYNY